MKICFECTECRKSYTRYYKNIDPKFPKHPFCSISCKNIWQSKNMSGANNPNFNKKWDENKKKSHSDLVKSKVDDVYRNNCAKANKGIKFSKERIQKMHEHRDFDSYSHPHTEESKRLIGLKSAAKFDDPAYRIKARQTMEERGYWVPLRDRPAFNVYNDEAEWITNMFEDLSQDQCNEINKIGIFNTKTNQKGYCRDHMYSRKDGFDNLVFPEILRHPCNCDFILHSLNSSKKSKSSKTLEQLFLDIQKYNGEWHEHQRVLDLIESYNLGLRWDIQQFIEGVYSV